MALADPPPLEAFVESLLQHSPLTADERQAIFDLPVAADEVGMHRDIYGVEGSPRHCIFVQRGMLARYQQNRGGERMFTRLSRAGDMADLDQVTGLSGAGGLTALCPTAILRVQRSALSALTYAHPGIAGAFWRAEIVHAERLAQLALHIGKSSARTRIAHLFAQLAIAFGHRDRPALAFALPLTQEHLGAATGLTAVHVNRTLRGMGREGLMTFKNRKVEIGDWDALTRIGELRA